MRNGLILSVGRMTGGHCVARRPGNTRVAGRVVQFHRKIGR
ncbi:hypothetical protein EDC15_10323 [Acetobacter aceti NBRC 14818]|nr:hypothetical protein EDC15_10323 [Acetobacter aceti NBRC 14818]